MIFLFLFLLLTILLSPIQPDEDKSKEIYASEDCRHLLRMWEEFYPAIGFNPPWVGYFVKADESIIGSCALIKDSENKTAEISYWAFKEHEGQGISTQSCKMLVEIARKADSSLKIIAKTAPEKNASTSILEKNGFVFTRIVQDHEIGDAWE